MKKDKEFKKALKITPEEVKTFFQDRPCLSVMCFEKAAKLPTSTIANFLKGERGLPQKHIDNIVPLMEHYGYDYLAD